MAEQDEAIPEAKKRSSRPPFSTLLLALAKTTGEEGATEDAEGAIRDLGLDEQVVALQNAAEVFSIFALRNYEGRVLRKAMAVCASLSDFVTARVELAQLQASMRSDDEGADQVDSE